MKISIFKGREKKSLVKDMESEKEIGKHGVMETKNQVLPEKGCNQVVLHIQRGSL